MFTGLVTAVGRIARVVRPTGGGLDLEIEAPFRGLTVGESVSVDGACLTVVVKKRRGFGVRVVATTLERTLFGERVAGDRVNLERALVVGDRLGGHLVQGHVDGIATVVKTSYRGDAWLIDLAIPEAVAAVSVPLGSITVAGVSLTINRILRRGQVQLSLIPHTCALTTLGQLSHGDRLHVEGDVIGKYVGALVEPRRGRQAKR